MKILQLRGHRLAGSLMALALSTNSFACSKAVAEAGALEEPGSQAPAALKEITLSITGMT